MLSDKRRQAIEQDFDEHGHNIDLHAGSTRERQADAILHTHMCGWACKCLLTRLNFAIAGICFTFVLYVLSETTTFFETISHKLTGLDLPQASLSDKSFERFLASHYALLCLFGPCVVLTVAAIFYLQQFSHLFDCPCTGHRSQFSSQRKGIALRNEK